MVNNNISKYSYNYGNTAVELKPEVKRGEKPQIKKQRRPKNNLKLKFKMMSIIVIVGVFSFLTLLRFASIVNLQSEIRDVKKEIVEIQKENENIRVQIAKQNNLKKIEELAVSQYNMIEPKLDSILYVDVKPLSLPEEKEKTTALDFVQRLLGLIY